MLFICKKCASEYVWFKVEFFLVGRPFFHGMMMMVMMTMKMMKMMMMMMTMTMMTMKMMKMMMTMTTHTSGGGDD